jgi:uncharacterized OsmC-like protein
METEFITNLEQVHDYEFVVSFDKVTIKTLTLDEPAPTGTEKGPNASRVLASAVGHCLSASLLFCLQRARVPIKRVSTKVRATLARNEVGRWRVQGIKVDIKADPVNE